MKTYYGTTNISYRLSWCTVLKLRWTTREIRYIYPSSKPPIQHWSHVRDRTGTRTLLFHSAIDTRSVRWAGRQVFSILQLPVLQALIGTMALLTFSDRFSAQSHNKNDRFGTAYLALSLVHKQNNKQNFMKS
jgi:hypothetical protein